MHIYMCVCVCVRVHPFGSVFSLTEFNLPFSIRICILKITVKPSDFNFIRILKIFFYTMSYNARIYIVRNYSYNHLKTFLRLFVKWK